MKKTIQPLNMTTEKKDALTGKTIYIVSQEDWGGMFISKHHYAVELARRGNKVFFINGPDHDRKLRRGQVKRSPSGHDNLTVVSHRTFFPLFFKYRFPRLYRLLLPLHLRNVVGKTGSRPDIIWSFDLTNTLPFECFPGRAINIYMPVDEATGDDTIRAADHADLILSVTWEILAKYPQKVPKHFVNHGVAEKHINKGPYSGPNDPLHVGYSGSVLRADIDRKVMLELVRSNPDMIFDFYGEYDYAHSVIHLARYRNPETEAFIEALKQEPNVRLHGIVPQAKLSEEIRKMDVLLICYDVNIEQSHGTNYHKVLEYLGSGKCVLSNNITTYEKHFPGMVRMTSSRVDNSELPAMLTAIKHDIRACNAPEEQERRVRFAEGFTYPKQVERIAGLIEALRPAP